MYMSKLPKYICLVWCVLTWYKRSVMNILPSNHDGSYRGRPLQTRPFYHSLNQRLLFWPVFLWNIFLFLPFWFFHFSQQALKTRSFYQCSSSPKQNLLFWPEFLWIFLYLLFHFVHIYYNGRTLKTRSFIGLVAH